MKVDYGFMPKKGFGGPFMDFFGAMAGNQIYLIYAIQKFPRRIQNPNPTAQETFTRMESGWQGFVGVGFLKQVDFTFFTWMSG